MKYTLINGGAGFIGSRIVEKFNKKEIKINLKKKITDDFFKGRNINYLDFSKKNIDLSFLKNVKTIIHAASLNKVESDRFPAKSKLVNYDFLKRFIDACKNYRVKRFIKISTSKVYGDLVNKKISEYSPLNPFDTYTDYHAKSDILLNKLSKNSYMDIVVLRVSNGYGYPVFNYPKCWKLIINSFCYQAYHQKKIKIKSKSNFIKNFVDMNYLIKVLKFFNYYPKRVNGIYNIGSKDNLSIYDMAKNVKKIAEKNKLSNIKILTEFSNKETNINFFYSIKKLLDLGCVVKESRKNEINNIFRYLKKNG